MTKTGETHEVDALYPALGCIVRSDLATRLGASSHENGNLEVDDHQWTTIGGLYAAGDVVTDLHQLSVAFGHAAIATTDIHNRLRPNPRYLERNGRVISRLRPLDTCAPLRGRFFMVPE